MSISVSVSDNVGSVFRLLDKQRRSVIKRAANRTINDVARLARTQLVRDVSKRTGLQQKEFRDDIVLRRSNFNTLTAKIRARSRPYNRIRYRAKQVRRGVSVIDGRGRRTIKGAFIANGGRTVFKRRRGAGRLPIYAVWGPPINTAFVQVEAQRLFFKVTRQFGDRYRRNLVFYGRRFGFK